MIFKTVLRSVHIGEPDIDRSVTGHYGPIMSDDQYPGLVLHLTLDTIIACKIAINLQKAKLPENRTVLSLQGKERMPH